MNEECPGVVAAVRDVLLTRARVLSLTEVTMSSLPELRRAGSTSTSEPVGGSRELSRIRLASFAIALSLFGHALLVPLAMQREGEPEWRIGLVVGAMSLALVLGRLGSGWAIDRVGSRPFLIWGAALFGLTSFLMMVPSAPVLLLGYRLIQGVALASFTTAAVARIAEVAAEKRRSAEMSRWWVAFSTAAIVGPPGAGWIIEHGGMAAAFAAAGAAALAAAWIATAVPRRQLPRPPAPFRMLSRRALLPALVGAGLGVAAGAFLTFAPLHALELGLSNPGIYLAAYAVGMVAGQLGLGAVASRIGRSYALIPALLIGAAATMLLGRTHSADLALALSFVFGFTNSGVSPVLTTWAIERAPEAERARAASTSIASRELGAFVGAAALGAMLSLWGAVWSWLVIAGIVAVGAAAVTARTSVLTVRLWRITR